MERVQATKDLQHENGIVPKGSIGILLGTFPLATGGEVATIEWEQDGGNGPGTRLNAEAGEYEILP